MMANFVENITIKILVLLGHRLALLFLVRQVQCAVVVLAINRELDSSLNFLLVRRLTDRVASLVDCDGSTGQQRVLLLAELARLGLDLNLVSIRQAGLVKCCRDIFWHQNPRLLQILLRPALLGTKERSHPVS